MKSCSTRTAARPQSNFDRSLPGRAAGNQLESRWDSNTRSIGHWAPSGPRSALAWALCMAGPRRSMLGLQRCSRASSDLDEELDQALLAKGFCSATDEFLLW